MKTWKALISMNMWNTVTIKNENVESINENVEYSDYENVANDNNENGSRNVKTTM